MIGPRLIQEGAAAISISSPRGRLTDVNDELITGRLYGPSLFARFLDIVHSAVMIGLPMIGAGGVWTDKNVREMLSAGAMAVEMDASLWVPHEMSASQPP